MTIIPSLLSRVSSLVSGPETEVVIRTRGSTLSVVNDFGSDIKPSPMCCVGERLRETRLDIPRHPGIKILAKGLSGTIDAQIMPEQISTTAQSSAVIADQVGSDRILGDEEVLLNERISRAIKDPHGLFAGQPICDKNVCPFVGLA